jgi:hypothetical protein
MVVRAAPFAEREQIRKRRMNFIVQYRQGSFRREFRCSNIDEAILAAGRMLPVDGCSEFQIVGAEGQLLLDQSEIVKRHKQIRDDGDEPSPEAA